LCFKNSSAAFESPFAAASYSVRDIVISLSARPFISANSAIGSISFSRANSTGNIPAASASASPRNPSFAFS
jgi:hypothetical protein